MWLEWSPVNTINIGIQNPIVMEMKSLTYFLLFIKLMMFPLNIHESNMILVEKELNLLLLMLLNSLNPHAVLD